MVASKRAESVREALKPMLERLDGIARLPEGWSEYDSPAVTPIAIETARRLMKQVSCLDSGLAPKQVAPYTVAAVDGGGVQVEYRGKGLALEVQIEPDGTLGYFLADEGAERPSHEEGENASWDVILDLARRVLAA
jgi:hypothetical protein